MTDIDTFYSIFAGGKREGRFPERHLLSAVLRRALYDYFGSDRSHARDAEEWIFCGNPTLREFSFAWICEQLMLDAELMLEQIKKLASSSDSGRGIFARKRFG